MFEETAVALKLKIVESGWGFLLQDVGKYVEIVAVLDFPLSIGEHAILVKPVEGVEYSTLENESFFGIANWVLPRSFGLTAEQIKEMLEKEQQKEEPVEEFYKTLKVGDIVKVEGEDRDYRHRYNAVVKVVELYNRYRGDYGFDAELLSGFVGGKGAGENLTIGSSDLEGGYVVVSPVDKKECKGEYSTAHYETYYELTEEDIQVGKIKMDAYFVGKVWKTGSRDDSGALWHSLKTIARFGEKNSVEREIKALYNQAKALARIYNVELGDDE